MSNNSHSGNPSSESAKAENSPYLQRAVLESVLVSYDADGLTIIDDQDILLSSLSGQLAMLQSLAVNVSTHDCLEINAGDFIGYVDALQRQLSVIKAVHEGIAFQLSNLKKQASNNES